jgi:hypothetical protein
VCSPLNHPEADMLCRRVLACAAFMATSALAGPYDQPYAIIEVGDKNPARDEHVPAITQIDGKSTRNTRKTDPIEPGKHRVRVRFETARVQQSPAEAQRDIEMNLEGCTLYRVVAKRTDGTNWEPKFYSQPLGECAKKFKKKAE